MTMTKRRMDLIHGHSLIWRLRYKMELFDDDIDDKFTTNDQMTIDELQMT